MRDLLLVLALALVGCSRTATPEIVAPDLGLAGDCLVVRYGEWTPARTRPLPWPDTIMLSRAQYVPASAWERQQVRPRSFEIVGRDSSHTSVIGQWSVDGPGYMVTISIGGDFDRVQILARTIERGLIGHALHADDLGEAPGVWEAAGKPAMGTVVRVASVELNRIGCR